MKVRSDRTLGWLALGVLVTLTACSDGAGRSHADLVITGGRVLTLDQSMPAAEALAVQGDTILAIGTTEEIEFLIGAETQVIELDPDNLVLPGLIDAHRHYMSLGESLMQLGLRAPRSCDEIVDGKVMIDGAEVITADIKATNGVIHVIRKVFLPRM